MSCYDYYCKYDCCNSAGYCPSSKSGCVYYYSSALKTAQIVGIVIGIIAFIVCIVIIIVCCVRKRNNNSSIQTIYYPPQPQPQTTQNIVYPQPLMSPQPLFTG